MIVGEIAGESVGSGGTVDDVYCAVASDDCVIAGVGGNGVDACSTFEAIVPLAADDQVISRAAADDVVVRFTDERVVAAAGLDVFE